MFEIPAAKRVKRSELLEDTDDTDTNLQRNDTATDEDDVPSYGFEYEFVESNVAPPVSEGPKEEIFQFNLFKAPSRGQLHVEKSNVQGITEKDLGSTKSEAKSQPALISIRSPTPELSHSGAEGGLSRSRPDAFYFTASTSSSTLDRLQQEYNQSAISGEAILSASVGVWKGTYLSWRVLNLPAHPRQIVEDRAAKVGQNLSDIVAQRSAGVNGPKSVHHAQRRPRPSKKRRDLSRRKATHRQAIIDATKTKEEHEKEKRNKKNRERKLKRRAKERKDKEEAKVAAIDLEADD